MIDIKPKLEELIEQQKKLEREISVLASEISADSQSSESLKTDLYQTSTHLNQATSKLELAYSRL